MLKQPGEARMKQFEYNAQCEGGAAVSGTIEASDADEALKRLLAMHLSNIELGPVQAPPKRRSIRSDDFIFFNEQLASLASTGLCLDAGLRQLGKDIRSPRLRRMLNETAADIEKGVPLDQALEKRAARMPSLYGRVVRAGVQSGQLAGTLLNLSHHLRLIAQTRRLVAEALAYPAIVLVLALGMVTAIMLLIVPQFAAIFADFNTTLPALTLVIIGLAEHLPQILSVLGAVILLVVLAWWMLRLIPRGRLIRERAVLAIPALGAIVRNSVRARFLRAMAFSVNSGLPLPEALRLSAEATASPGASLEAHQIAQRIEQGESAYAACQGANVVPAMFGYVVVVNADRNNLEEGLIQLSKAYESRAVHSQSLLRAWLAPVGVLAVGLIIGMCILALFLPLVSLLQSVS